MQKSRRTFMGSMTDLFHPEANVYGSFMDTFAREIESLREGCKNPQVVMLLTKRPRLLLYFQQHYFPVGQVVDRVCRRIPDAVPGEAYRLSG